MFPVEAFQETMNKLAVILDGLQIRYHLTGGLTGTAYGEPRMTQDIDLVVDPQQLSESLADFLAMLKGSDFLFDEATIRKAVDQGGQFQLLDQQETLKLDVYARELIPGELDRTVMLEVFQGQELPVVSRVDAAASKLVWISKGSHKSRRDLRAIHRNASETEQREIAKTAAILGLRQLLTQTLNEPDELQ